jgi:hypothetical protein
MLHRGQDRARIPRNRIGALYVVFGVDEIARRALLSAKVEGGEKRVDRTKTKTKKGDR